MTPQEQEMIGDLMDRVQKTQLTEKDPDAEAMLQQGLGKNPDALYILAQTVLVQKYALEQAQAQLAQAKAQIEQMQQHPEPKHATSFLGSLLGRNESPAAPPPPPPPPSYAQSQQGYPPQQGYAPAQAYPQYAPVGGGYGAPMGGGGGFLRNAAQTAAGVAAGALAFQGIESLMHGFGHAAGYGQDFGGFGGGGQRPVEEVVNNYYGDDRGERGGGHEVSADERALGDQQDRDFGSLDSKSDRDSLYGSSGDGGSGLNEDGDSNLDDSGSNLDDANLDDSSFDDGGSDFGDDGSGGGDDGSFA
jgi:hypothetical protein